MLKNNKGYSLVELVIYVSLMAIIILVVVNTVLSFTKTYKEVGALRIVEHSGEDAMERMTREIRGATSIDNANSTLGTSPGVLTLISGPSGATKVTKFYVQNYILKMDINGSYYGPLSLSNASVTSMTFRDLSSGISHAVKLDLTIQGTSGTITKTKTYHSTIILKGQ